MIRGTSVRDSTGIVHYNDFLNQLQFADVGNQLNNRVLTTVLKSLDIAALEGRTISFAGTASALGTAQPVIRDLVAIRLSVEERP